MRLPESLWQHHLHGAGETVLCALTQPQQAVRSANVKA